MILLTTRGDRRGYASRPVPARRRVDRPLSLDRDMGDGLTFLDLGARPAPVACPLELAETLADLLAPLSRAQRDAVRRVVLDGDEPADLSPVDRRCLAAGLARLRELHGATPPTPGEAR